MAATVSSVWSKPGAWALDSEEHEEELKREMERKITEPPAADFPSLAAAASAKPKKKNKGQTLSLAEFSSYSSAPKPAAYKPQRPTQDEIFILPTGPRERTAEELDRTRLGGGFRNYGGGDSSRVRVSDRNEGYNSNSTRERDLGPSRADEADDWSKTKTFGGSFGPERSERRDKVGFFNSSRADDVDNWASNKSFAPSSEAPRRERRMGFESYANGSGSDADVWSKRKDERTVEADNWGRKREERAADSENWGRKKEEGKEISNANGAGRPRLNLQPRTLPINNGQSLSPTVIPIEGGKPKGANPFGDARPREEILAEKGKDWKEIDQKLEAAKIKELGGGEKDEGFGRRKGFGMGSADEKAVKTWRKPEPNDASPPPPASSAEETENSGETAQNSDSIEKVPEEN